MIEFLNQPLVLNTRYYSHQYNENAEFVRRVVSVAVNVLLLTSLIAPYLTNSLPVGSLVTKITGVSSLINGVRVFPELCLWITGQAYCETDTTTGQIKYEKSGHAKKKDATTIFINVVTLGARTLSGALLLNSLSIVNVGLYSQTIDTGMFRCWAVVLGTSICNAPDNKSLWLEFIALPCDFKYLSETREMEIISLSIVTLNNVNWTWNHPIPIAKNKFINLIDRIVQVFPL